MLVEKGASRLEALAERAAASGGVAASFADELAEDAVFLRKLKPSLILARARGELPTDQEPGTEAAAPTGPQLDRRSRAAKAGGPPNPFLVIGAALAAGIALAKIIDWRGHAHPRD